MLGCLLRDLQGVTCVVTQVCGHGIIVHVIYHFSRLKMVTVSDANQSWHFSIAFYHRNLFILQEKDRQGELIE
jgi:hypothetical protein